MRELSERQIEKIITFKGGLKIHDSVLQGEVFTTVELFDSNLYFVKRKESNKWTYPHSELMLASKQTLNSIVAYLNRKHL